MHFSLPVHGMIAGKMLPPWPGSVAVTAKLGDTSDVRTTLHTYSAHHIWADQISLDGPTKHLDGPCNTSGWVSRHIWVVPLHIWNGSHRTSGVISTTHLVWFPHLI